MTKQEIRSLIFNLLPKYDKSNKWHARFLDAAIEQTINEFYWEIFAVDTNALQRYTVSFGYDEAEDVDYEDATQLYYSTLPTDIVAFPDKASGVRRIQAIVQTGMTFYPMSPREHDLIRSGSYFDTLTSKIGYSVNQERIEYYNMTEAIADAGVRMDVIQRFSSYADTDTVLIPELRDKEGNTFETRVLAKLQLIQPVSLSEDTDETIKTEG